MKTASGTVLYRMQGETLEVLLVHPSGNYNRRAPWSIPKGEPNAGEKNEKGECSDSQLEAVARRETWEETGLKAGELQPLGYIDYRRSRKRVFAFAGRAPDHASPRPASWEVDQACFLPLEEAKKKIHPDQLAFLERLADLETMQVSSIGSRP